MTQPKGLAGQHILVVEDDYFIAFDLVSTLETAGVRVVGPAASLSGALDLVAQADRLDGAILDINLQGEMVYPLVDVLKARDIPVVFATGYGRHDILARYADVPLCEKPIQPQKVASLMFG
jgi:CheY-like chemotaxis protein